tara:strand:+ start:129 stop:602 length:474 start_codon:yes stop_codon:yes gene_type:complete
MPKTTGLAASIVLIIGLALLGAIVYNVLGIETTTKTEVSSEPDINIYIKSIEEGVDFGFVDQNNNPFDEITINKGQIIKITFENSGTVPHNFRITDNEIYDADVLFDSAIGSTEKPLLSEEIGTTTFVVNKSGTFNFICSIPGHIESGMSGKFIVEE